MSSYPPPAPSNAIKFNPENFLAAQSALTISIGDTRYLRLNGGFVTGITTFDSGVTLNGNSTITGELFMTGNAKDIHIDGIGSKINFSGLGSGIIMSSLTSSISMNSTLSNSISTAGGISVGSVLFGATQASYLSSITLGVGQASKALILDGSSNIGSINTLSASIINGTTINGTAINGSTITASTAISIPNSSGGDMITLTSTSTSARNTIKFVTDTQTYEIGTRGSTASNPNSFYIYNGAYKLLMNPTGDTSILSSTDSTGATTGCLKLSGGLGVIKNIYCTGWLDLNRNGSNLNITNPSSGVQALIELPATVNILRLVRGYAVNVGANGVGIESASARDPRCALDFGQSASNMIISLYNDTSSYYGLSANNSNMQYSTGGGHSWYSSCSNASPINFNAMNLTSAGTLTTAQNLIASCGVHASTFSTVGLAALGNSAHMHYAGSVGSFFTYNYNNSTYGNTMIGNNSIASCSNGYVNINTSSFSQNAPLAVFGSAPFTRVTGFGWLASSGSGTAVGFTNRPFSIYSEWGIIVGSGEIDVFSDLRMKKDVLALDDELCARFIKNISPIQFKYNHDEDREHYGYAAQQLMAYGYTTLVGVTHADEPLPEEKIPTYIPDPDGELGDMKLSGESIDLPGDVRCVVSMIDMIPMLHKCIQKQQEAITNNLKAINSLQEQIRVLSSTSSNDTTQPVEENPIGVQEPLLPQVLAPVSAPVVIRRRRIRRIVL